MDSAALEQSRAEREGQEEEVDLRFRAGSLEEHALPGRLAAALEEGMFRGANGSGG